MDYYFQINIFIIIYVLYIFVFQPVINRYYDKYKKVRSIIPLKNKDIFKILCRITSEVSKMYYIKFIQYMNSSVVQLDKNVYEITYVVNNKTYKMIVSPKKGPPPILQVINDDNDVTELIIPYAGPSFDWHNNKFTPSFFGYSSLTFELSDGDEKTFSESDVIII